MSKDKLAQVFHFDLYGKRDDKYNFLNENSLNSIDWKELDLDEPDYFFVKKDFDLVKIYQKGISLDDLFLQKSSGVETRKDSLVIAFEENTLQKVLDDFLVLGENELIVKYSLDNNSRDWKVESAKNDLKNNNPRIRDIQYRPFDTRKIIYTGITKGINGYPMFKNFKNFIGIKNIGITYERQCVIGDFTNVIVSNSIVDGHILGTAFSKGYTAPLYLYPETNTQLSIGESQNRVPNLNMDIVNQIADLLDIHFEPDKNVILEEYLEGLPWYFGPLDLLDYIYGVLHSPNYRMKYKEFLKIDFPRVPFPTSKRMFFMVKNYGGKLRALHLLESPEVENYITQYPVDGDNVVDKPMFVVITSETKQSAPSVREIGNVYINKTQYFKNVPKIAWEFYIGGYQPAQKWLKDRKGRALSFEDILHYQKMIVALTKTADLMVEIDGVLEV
jgi:predicted helicase